MAYELAAQTHGREVNGPDRQYSLAQILLIWAAATVPMALLGWVAAPAIGDRLDLGVGDENREAFTRGGLLTLGLIWQFVLAMIVVRREEGDLRWATIKRRCWLNTPRDPASGEPRPRLWLWLIPFTLGFALLQLVPFSALVEAVAPSLAEPARYSFDEIVQSEERKAALEGAWQLLGLFIVLGVFNTVLGEELIFRGILLPRMNGVFGNWDWVANALLFGLYHLHQPWGIPMGITSGLLFAYGTKRFRSAWMGIIPHSGQTIFFLVIALGLVLGFA